MSANKLESCAHHEVVMMSKQPKHEGMPDIWWECKKCNHKFIPVGERPVYTFNEQYGIDWNDAWVEQLEWLKRLRDSGQRQKAMAALCNMQDIEERRKRQLKTWLEENDK